MSRSRGAAALKVTDAVPVFVALGDATRLSLLKRLSVDGPLSITRLSEGTGVTRQAITRHLNTLGNVGLVRHSRRGRERVWELERRRLDIAKRYLDRIAAQWDAAAERLRAFVEDR
jgi:DNA-binding transcriptional ArsR family regulator